MTDQQVFDSIFDKGAIQEPDEDVSAKADPAVEPDEKQDAKSVETKKPDEKIAPVVEDDRRVPLATLHEERRKRQELEARLAAIESRQQEATKASQAKDPGDVEAEFYRNPVAYLDAKLKEQREQLITEKVNASARAAKRRYADYEAAEAEFVAAARLNPSLLEEARAHHDPAEYAYRVGKQLSELSGVTDLASYKAKIAAEVEAEIRAKIAQEQQQRTPTPAAPMVAPPSPGAGRSKSAPRDAHVPTDEELFDSIFGAGKRRRKPG